MCDWPKCDCDIRVYRQITFESPSHQDARGLRALVGGEYVFKFLLPTPTLSGWRLRPRQRPPARAPGRTGRISFLLQPGPSSDLHPLGCVDKIMQITEKGRLHWNAYSGEKIDNAPREFAQQSRTRGCTAAQRMSQTERTCK